MGLAPGRDGAAVLLAAILRRSNVTLLMKINGDPETLDPARQMFAVSARKHGRLDGHLDGSGSAQPGRGSSAPRLRAGIREFAGINLRQRQGAKRCN